MHVHSVRKVWVTVVVCAAAAVGGGAAAAGALAQDASMHALITVLAPSSGPVDDLAAKDFKVQAGKRTLEVTAADRATEPLSIELLVDNSQAASQPSVTADLRSALQGFVQTIRAADPEAQIGLYTFAGAPSPAVKLGAPARDLDSTIARLSPAPEPSGALLEALGDASHDLAERPAPRRAIVSVDFASAESTPDIAARNVPKTVYQCAPTVWALSVTGAVPEMPKRDSVLQVVTRHTGGERLSIVQSTGLAEQLKAIANSLLSQYTIEFPRPPGQLEELKIDTPKGKALATMFAR